VRRNGLVVQKISSDFLLVSFLTSKDKAHDRLFLSNYATLNILDEIKRIQGVGSAQIFGGQDYAMRVWLRPDRMAQLGVTTSDISAAIQTQNAQYAAGKIGQDPAPNDQQIIYTVTAKGRLLEPEQFGNIIIRADGPNGILYLKDVARIELGAQSYNVRSALNGQPGVAMGVFLQSGANALETAKSIKLKMEELKQRFPAGMEYSIPYDTSEFVKATIEEVFKTLGEALILVVLVVFLFLQSWRATLIPIIAVPISLIGTFAGLYLLGFTINLLTLFAMILAIGIVVDDAIVVLENVERLMRDEKLNPLQAAIKSMEQVSSAVIAIVMVLCAVFFHKVTNFYTHIVDITLRHKIIGAVVFAAIIALCAVLLNRVPGSLVPQEDQGYVITLIIMPDGATLNRTEKTTEAIRQAIAPDSAVQFEFAIVGLDFIGGGNKTSAGTMFVRLKDWKERTTTADEISGKLGGIGMGQPDGFAFAVNPPAIRGLGSSAGFEMYVQSRSNSDPQKLAAVLNNFVGIMRADPTLTGINTFFRPTVPQLYIEVDEAKALSLGVPIPDIYAALQSTMGQLYVNDFNKSGRTYKVQLQAEPQYRSKPEDIGKIYVRSKAGQMIPLSSLSKVSRVIGAEQLERYNGLLSAKVLGAGAPGVSSGDAIKQVEKLAKENLPDGYQVAWTGQAYQEKLTGSAAVFAFGFAMIMVFLILAAQFETWALPLAVIMAVPFALAGALLAVLVRGMPNDIYFQIGLITLIGLAAKNAILIVEFASQKMEEGKPAMQAAIEAAQLRFRPIVMTSMAFVLGITPLLIATGAGAAARRSMGTGVFGGMILATFIATIFIPLFFTWLSGKHVRTHGHAHDAEILDVEERSMKTIKPANISTPGDQ
jgi:multidrug efflux pump